MYCLLPSLPQTLLFSPTAIASMILTVQRPTMEHVVFLPPEIIPLTGSCLWTGTWRFCLGCSSLTSGRVLEQGTRPDTSGFKKQRLLKEARKIVVLCCVLVGWLETQRYASSGASICQKQHPYQDPSATGLHRAWDSGQELRACSESKAILLPRSQWTSPQGSIVSVTSFSLLSLRCSHYQFTTFSP